MIPRLLGLGLSVAGGGAGAAVAVCVPALARCGGGASGLRRWFGVRQPLVEKKAFPEVLQGTDSPFVVAAPGVVSKHRPPEQVKIKAHYVSSSLDVGRFCRDHFSYYPRVIRGNTAVVQLDNRSGSEVGDSSLAHAAALAASSRYLVLFPYGAVVMFNMDKRAEEKCLQWARLYAMAPNITPTKEDYSMEVSADLPSFCRFHFDHLAIQEFDLNIVRVLSTVLSQTVAMDFYEKRVDRMLQQFRSLNSKLETHGLLRLDKDKLFKLVASNNAILTDMITQLKLLDRSDTAWRHGKFDDVWYGLREDFEVSERFTALEFKLQHIAHNTKFFLEVLHNQKSDTLEWVIIVLLAFEIVLCAYEIYQTSKNEAAVR